MTVLHPMNELAELTHLDFPVRCEGKACNKAARWVVRVSPTCAHVRTVYLACDIALTKAVSDPQCSKCAATVDISSVEPLRSRND